MTGMMAFPDCPLSPVLSTGRHSYITGLDKRPIADGSCALLHLPFQIGIDVIRTAVNIAEKLGTAEDP